MIDADAAIMFESLPQAINRLAGLAYPLWRNRNSSKGWLQLSPAFGYEGIHLTAHIAGKSKGDPGTNIDEPEQEHDPWQFTREADYFAICIATNQTPKPCGEEGLRDMRYMADIYRTAGVTCKQDGQLVRNLANEIKINRGVILSFPEHEARVLETPLNIGNDELSPRRCLRSIHVNLHRNRQVVRIAE
jgi:hypothetical protein